MQRWMLSFFIVFGLLFPLSLFAQPAGPYNADGYGALTMGTGQPATEAIEVYSDADSGNGSLRAAFAEAEAITSINTPCNSIKVLITFGHTIEQIELLSTLQMRDVACIHMVSPGVMIRGAQVLIRDAKHIVVSNTIFEGSPTDGLTMQNVEHFIVNNNSFRDAGDENIGIADSKFGSVIDNIISLKAAGASECTIIIDLFQAGITSNITFARNVCVDQIDRSPLVQFVEGKVNIVNNLIAEWGRNTSGGAGTRINGDQGNLRDNLYWKFTGSHDDDAVGFGSVSNPNWYFDGNLSVGDEPDDINLLSTSATAIPTPAVYRVERADAADVACLVAATAGARPWDAHDMAVMSEFTQGCN